MTIVEYLYHLGIMHINGEDCDANINYVHANNDIDMPLLVFKNWLSIDIDYALKAIARYHANKMYFFMIQQTEKDYVVSDIQRGLGAQKKMFFNDGDLLWLKSYRSYDIVNYIQLEKTEI